MGGLLLALKLKSQCYHLYFLYICFYPHHCMPIFEVHLKEAEVGHGPRS